MYARHWFTEPGVVGERLPFCLRCGVPSPKCPTCGRPTSAAANAVRGRIEDPIVNAIECDRGHYFRRPLTHGRLA
jgi:hypothetical protein